MNIIYLDTLFFINFITDYITFLTTAKICGAVIRRHLIITAAAFGAMYAVLYTYCSNTWIDQSVTKLTAAALICLIAFHREQHLLRCTITFMIVSSVFGGLLSAFVIKSSSVHFIQINIKTLIIVFILVYLFLTIYYRNFSKNTARSFHKAVIKFRNKAVSLTVLHDTGNELSDPISNLPVLIIDKNLFSLLIPELNQYAAETDIYNIFYLLSQYESLKGRMRLIPYQSISEKGALLGFIPDIILIDEKQTEMVVTCSLSKLSQTNQYQGII